MESQPLDFEKPILELQRRLQDLKNHSDEHELDFESEVEAMENKIRETRREIYDNLTAWQRVQIARHIQPPFRARLRRALLHRLGRTARRSCLRRRQSDAERPGQARRTIAASSSPIKRAATRRRT